MSVNFNSDNYTRLRRKSPRTITISDRKERNLSIKKVSRILQKDESLRTKEEKELLYNYSEIVREASLRIEKRKKLKERLKEFEDSEAILDAKCKKLAEAILKAEYLVVYTGAGISTAARIPDYRGATGIWTLLQQGKDIGTHDLTQANPTYTHMALFQLYLQGKLKHIVSQNCDGLHLRSGLPKKVLSEVHGNMYIEVCQSCRPIIEYLRLFDVTENTARYSHKTMRKCYKCNSSLVDSIVHFGERGNLPWPLNWKGACRAAERADMILCMGSSLKVLKRYPWLWCMDKPIKRRPGIYIVNLQWTPKDCQAIIKINGKCDRVMEKLMTYLKLSVPEYSRKSDPIFEHATDLCKEERHTSNRPFLKIIKSENTELNEIKVEKSEENFEIGNSMFSSVVLDHDIKSEIKEPCVTSSKEEIIIDTGQGKETKYIKKELILITIRSGDNFEECCSSYAIAQNHSLDCPNFIDEENDIPVIIEDDLAALKNFEDLTRMKRNDVNSSIKNDINISISDKSINSIEGNLSLMQTVSVDKVVSCSKVKRPLEVDKSDEFCNKKSKGNKNSEPAFQGMKEENNGVNGREMKKESSNKNTFCKYCREQYFSTTCLFYTKRQPVFKKGVSACDCCSSEDEESGPDAPEEKPSDLQKVATVNPGWYGKGLRKNFRKKR